MRREQEETWGTIILTGVNSAGKKVPIVFEYLGQGSFNATYKATLTEDVTLGNHTLRKGQSIVYKETLENTAVEETSPLSPNKNPSFLTPEERALDTPERSIRIWEIINPGLPAFKLDDNQAQGWFCPFIESKEKPTEKEIFDATIDIFNRTHRVVADAHVEGNFLKTTDNQIICIDVGYAFDIRKKPDSDEPVSEASFNIHEKKDGVLTLGNSAVVNLTRALLYLQKNFPEEKDASFLKGNYEAVLRLANANYSTEIDINALKHPTYSFSETLRNAIDNNATISDTIKSNLEFSSKHVELMNKFPEAAPSFLYAIANLSDITIEIMTLFVKDSASEISDEKLQKVIEKINQLMPRSTEELFRDRLENLTPEKKGILLEVISSEEYQVMPDELINVLNVVRLSKPGDKAAIGAEVSHELNLIRQEALNEAKLETARAAIISLIHQYCGKEAASERAQSPAVKHTPGQEKILRAQEFEKQIISAQDLTEIQTLLQAEKDWNKKFQGVFKGLGNYGKTLEKCELSLNSATIEISMVSMGG